MLRHVRLQQFCQPLNILFYNNSPFLFTADLIAASAPFIAALLQPLNKNYFFRRFRRFYCA